jgi:hypothetical protein
VKGELFDAVSVELLRRTDADTLQPDLEAALVHFGEVLANDATDLYENLLRDLRSRTDFGRHPGLVRVLVAHETFLMELLPDAARLRSAFNEIDEIYRTQGVFPAMGRFGLLVEEGGPKYSEEMAQTPPTPEGQEMMARMAGNFDLFIAHELHSNSGYPPDIDALRAASTRIVSAAGETSGEQGARRSALALAERLGIPVTPLPGAHGGWGSDPQEFADKLHEALQKG